DVRHLTAGHTRGHGIGELAPGLRRDSLRFELDLGLLLVELLEELVERILLRRIPTVDEGELTAVRATAAGTAAAQRAADHRQGGPCPGQLQQATARQTASNTGLGVM